MSGQLLSAVELLHPQSGVYHRRLPRIYPTSSGIRTVTSSEWVPQTRNSSLLQLPLCHLFLLQLAQSYSLLLLYFTSVLDSIQIL